MRNYSPRPVLPVDRPTDGRTDTYVHSRAGCRQVHIHVTCLAHASSHAQRNGGYSACKTAAHESDLCNESATDQATIFEQQLAKVLGQSIVYSEEKA